MRLRACLCGWVSGLLGALPPIVQAAQSTCLSTAVRTSRARCREWKIQSWMSCLIPHLVSYSLCEWQAWTAARWCHLGGCKRTQNMPKWTIRKPFFVFPVTADASFDDAHSWLSGLVCSAAAMSESGMCTPRCSKSFR